MSDSTGFTRAGFAAAAMLCGAVALLLPGDWYENLPRQQSLADLIMRGDTLLRLTFAFEAIVLAVVALMPIRQPALGLRREAVASGKRVSGDVSSRTILFIMVTITALALVLRLISISSDLWIDEIVTVVNFRGVSFIEVVGSYLRSNNHLLNSLLVQLSISMFGEHEWSVRLPAVLFGVATVPVLYWTSRPALSRLAAAGASLMLATSYHHIFFSQNARGYTAYMLFALLSTGALVRALASDRARHWGIYIAAVVFGFASLLTSAFVFAAQILVAFASLAQRRRNVSGPTVGVRRLALVFGLAALLSFQLYATSLPDAYAVITSVYREQGTGFALLSLDFLNDVTRGIAAGFGGLSAAGIFVVLGGIGFAALVRAHWQLAGMIALPMVLVTAFLLFRGLTFSPRLFLLAIPLATVSIMAAAEAVAVIARGRLPRIGARYGNMAVGLLAIGVSLLFVSSLPYYYRTPKQPYRAALEFIESSLTVGGTVAIVHVAQSGFEYYTHRSGTRDPSAYKYVRTVAAMDSLLASAGSMQLLVATTLPLLLRLDVPELADRIEACCVVARSFSGTLGDGAITIWEAKPK